MNKQQKRKRLTELKKLMKNYKNGKDTIHNEDDYKAWVLESIQLIHFT